MKAIFAKLLAASMLICTLFGALPAQADIQSQVNRLQDTQEIINLVNTFTIYLDEAEIDKYVNSFADGGHFKIENEQGKIDINLEKSKMSAFFTPRFAEFKKNGQQRRHLFTNVSVASQTQKDAFVRLNALLTSTQNNVLSLVTTMTYDLTLVKTSAGQWKFKEVVSKLDRALDAKVD